MRFCATRYEHGVAFAETIEADTWIEAASICRNNHWRLEGRRVLVLPAFFPDSIIDFLLWVINWLRFEAR